MNIKIDHMHGDIIEAGGVKNVTNHYHGPDRPTAAPRDLLLPGDEAGARLLEELTPIFFGIAEDAADFIRKARSMKPTEITRLAAQLVAQKVISDRSCGRDLWKPLSEHGIYTKSEQNWNRQVRDNLPVRM